MQHQIEAAGSGGNRVASTYTFDSLHLIVVYPGGLQHGANAGLVARGTVTDVTYSPSGRQLTTSPRPFAFTFSLRQTTSGHWLVTDTLDKIS